MDPLSITLGITTLLGLAKEVVLYVKETKDASEERRKFVIETSSLCGMLSTLVDFVKEEDPLDPWLQAVSEMVAQGGPFDQFTHALQQLKDKLKPVSGIRKFGQALAWKQIKGDVNTLLSQIERLKTLNGLALELDHMRLSHENKSVLKDVTVSIVDLKLSNTTIQHNTAAILDQASTHQKKELLDRICKVDYMQKHGDNIKKHQYGTGNWFLLDPVYQDWTRSSCGTLICPGVPGAGKTIIATLVIQEHLRAVQSAQHPVAFIYYDYRLRDQQTLRHTLETVLRQVIDYLPMTPESVDKLFSHTPSTEEIRVTLEELLIKCDRLTIVTDALDECHDCARIDVLSWIAGLQTRMPVRFLATTRDFCADASHSVFLHQPKLEIKASKPDLELYTRFRAGRLRIMIKPILLEDLVEGVVAAADGMFLLAELLMNSFDQKLKVKAIKTDLQALPKGLDAYDTAYGDAMARIFSQDKDCQESARRALSLILCARRPLKILELQHALMIEPGDTELDEDNRIGAEDILSVCAGLITIDESSETIRFVHYTTQEYLQRTQGKWLPLAKLEIARTCLDYLSLQDFARAVQDSITNMEFEMTRETFALAEYAIWNGPFHWNAVVATQTSFHAGLLSLLKSSQILSAVWLISWSFRFSRHTEFEILHWISQFDVPDLIDLCLDNGFSPHLEDEDECTPLCYIAQTGHEVAMKVLLRHNPDVHHRDAFGRTALSYAASGGNETVVRLLLAHDAAVDSADNSGSTSLSFAARSNHESVTRTLLEHNATVNLANTDGWTPLAYAADGGHTSIVQLLIKFNAKIDVKTPSGHTPLHAASRGHESASKILLEHGADPNSKTNEGRTPTSYAAGAGHSDTLELLLSNNADPNIVDRNGLGPLHLAVQTGSIETVKLLCNTNSVKVDSADLAGRTPLSYALERRDQTVVDMFNPGKTHSDKDIYNDIAQSLVDTGRVDLSASGLNKGNFSTRIPTTILS